MSQCEFACIFVSIDRRRVGISDAQGVPGCDRLIRCFLAATLILEFCFSISLHWLHVIQRTTFSIGYLTFISSDRGDRLGVTQLWTVGYALTTPVCGAWIRTCMDDFMR